MPPEQAGTDVVGYSECDFRSQRPGDFVAYFGSMVAALIALWRDSTMPWWRVNKNGEAGFVGGESGISHGGGPPLVVVVPIVIATGVAAWVLPQLVDISAPGDRLDVIKLVLARRRQWATEHDASEHRLTELYVKVVEQLGSEHLVRRRPIQQHCKV